MSLSRYSPFNEIRKLENDINSLFRGFDTQFYGESRALAIDLYETDDNYVIKAELPGFTKDNIDIQATSQYIDITAELNTEDEKEEGNLLVKERSSKKLVRRIGFDKPINPKEAIVELKDGILKVTLPMSEEAKSVKLMPS